MSLNLDPRQRAMLKEMGVHVWWPTTAPAEVSVESVRSQTKPAVPTTDSGVPYAYPASAAATNSLNINSPSKPPPAPPSPVNSMSWPELGLAMQKCQACAMGSGRRVAVLAPAPLNQTCDWLIVGDPADIEQERAGTPFAGEAGQLLDNMLRAVGVFRCTPATVNPASQQAYLSHVVKCRPALPRAPLRAELDQCAHFLRREIELTQPKIILAMGRFALQLLLSETAPEQQKLPLGKLRQQVWRFAGVPVVVTYPPSYLLRSGQDKANAWADLCLAQEIAQAGSANF